MLLIAFLVVSLASVIGLSIAAMTMQKMTQSESRRHLARRLKRSGSLKPGRQVGGLLVFAGPPMSPAAQASRSLILSSACDWEACVKIRVILVMSLVAREQPPTHRTQARGDPAIEESRAIGRRSFNRRLAYAGPAPGSRGWLAATGSDPLPSVWPTATLAPSA
jgi:hypothetical protein